MMVVMAVMAEARHLWKSYGNRPLGVNFSVNHDDSIRPRRNSMPSEHLPDTFQNSFPVLEVIEGAEMEAPHFKASRGALHEARAAGRRRGWILIALLPLFEVNQRAGCRWRSR